MAIGESNHTYFVAKYPAILLNDTVLQALIRNSCFPCFVSGFADEGECLTNIFGFYFGFFIWIFLRPHLKLFGFFLGFFGKGHLRIFGFFLGFFGKGHLDFLWIFPWIFWRPPLDFLKVIFGFF